MEPQIIQNMMQLDNDIQIIDDALVIVSQLARITEESYAAIDHANLYGIFKELLKHKNANIRSKTCNLIGNLCRHSGYFYEALSRSDMIPELIKRCKDSDQATRKFACFAIGNASYHSATLYAALKPSIPNLVELLADDPEERTRANSAGALGNLVRNSGELCQDLIQHGAVLKLLKTLSEDGTGARKIALFSLGNLCAYDECKAILKQHNFEQMVMKLAETFADDKNFQKYVTRIKYRMSTSSASRKE